MEVQPNRSVDEHDLDFLFAHFVHCEEVFQAAKSWLKPEHFSKAGEQAYRAMWRAISEYYDKFQMLPAYPALSKDTITNMEKMPVMTEEAIDMADGFCQQIFDEKLWPPTSMHPDAAMEILREVLVDRGPGAAIRSAIEDARGNAVYDLPKIVAEAREKIDVIQSIGRIKQDNKIPESFAQVGGEQWPTGVKFIDDMMDGGSEPGDCNVIIGGTGGGKTTLSMQMAVEIARLQDMYATTGDREPGLVVFFSYEDGLRMMQIRAMSYAAEVDKDTLRFLRSDDELSTTGDLKLYEQRMYQGSNKERLGERERLAEVRPWINQYVEFVDFNEGGEGGSGGIPEVRQRLMAIQRKRKMPIRAVFIDWAGQMVRNQLLAERGAVEGSNMALELGGLLGMAKREIATPLNCVVWVPHQLKGNLTKRSPGTTPHHSEAEWCASFANNAWYAFCIGKKDEQHSVCQVAATKTRHAESVPPVICKIKGEICRMEDVDEDFMFDPATGGLSLREEGERVARKVDTSRAQKRKSDKQRQIENTVPRNE